MNLLFLPLTCLLGIASPPAKAPVITLPGYSACQQASLVPEKSILSCYTLQPGNCQSGKVVLAYEKRSSPAKESPRYQIADTVQLQLDAAKNYLTTAMRATTAGKATDRRYFVLCQKDALGEKYLRNLLRVWEVNAQGKLVEVPVTTLKFLNDDFGA